VKEGECRGDPVAGAALGVAPSTGPFGPVSGLGTPHFTGGPVVAVVAEAVRALLAVHDLDSAVDTFEGGYRDVAGRPASVALRP